MPRSAGATSFTLPVAEGRPQALGLGCDFLVQQRCQVALAGETVLGAGAPAHPQHQAGGGQSQTEQAGDDTGADQQGGGAQVRPQHVGVQQGVGGVERGPRSAADSGIGEIAGQPGEGAEGHGGAEDAEQEVEERVRPGGGRGRAGARGGHGDSLGVRAGVGGARRGWEWRVGRRGAGRRRRSSGAGLRRGVTGGTLPVRFEIPGGSRYADRAGTEDVVEQFPGPEDVDRLVAPGAGALRCVASRRRRRRRCSDRTRARVLLGGRPGRPSRVGAGLLPRTRDVRRAYGRAGACRVDAGGRVDLGFRRSR